MNSTALVKVGEQSWIERTLGARGARALLAAAGTGALVLSIPATLLEQLSTSSGISEILPFLAPPLGVRARIALAIVLAMVAIALVWTFWGRRASNEDTDSMNQARKASAASAFGWGALVRLVRGEAAETIAPSDQDLSRRRRDRHPDAPPRPPLVASRDLPPPSSESSEQHVTLDAVADHEAALPSFDAPSPLVVPPPYELAPSDLAPAQAPDPVATDVADFLPRSPAPMSEAEMAQTIAAMPPRNGAPAAASILTDASPWSAAVRDLPLIDDGDIESLAGRFERGLERRKLVLHADLAQQSIASSLAFVQPDARVRTALRAISPFEIVTTPGTAFAEADGSDMPTPIMRVDEDVEAALNTALATLRKLTEQGRR